MTKLNLFAMVMFFITNYANQKRHVSSSAIKSHNFSSLVMSYLPKKNQKSENQESRLLGLVTSFASQEEPIVNTSLAR